ncbi:MAG: GNAT family N-acetyltransferase [Candidatus Cloacimonetes bacterium]|nr:GNAT family N-acetyltransferase [Candidatus Cloacimonadota bacterium]
MQNNDYRFLIPADFDEIIGLWQAAGLSHRPLGRDKQENIERQMREENTHFIGRYINAELAAVAILSHNGRKGWINRLAVSPGYQHQKVATEMIAFCENWLLAQGIEIFAVLIEDDNEASLQLFAKNNYKSHKDIIYFTKRIRDEV